MSIGRALARLRTNARYHGWLAALGLLSLDLMRRFIVIERVLLYELEGMPDGRRCPGPDRVRLATPDEVKALLPDPEFKFGRMSDARVDQLYAEGHRCVLNMHQGRAAGYSWLGFGDIDIPQVGMTVERLEHEGYIYKGFTHPSCRGKGAADDRYLFWMQHLLARGKRSAVAYFSFDNPATLRRVPKLGMRRIGAVTRLGIGPYRRVLFSGALRHRRHWPRLT